MREAGNAHAKPAVPAVSGALVEGLTRARNEARDYFAALFRGGLLDLEEAGMAHEIEFDAVEVVVLAKFLNELELEFPRLLMDPVMHTLVGVIEIRSQPVFGMFFVKTADG